MNKSEKKIFHLKRTHIIELIIYEAYFLILFFILITVIIIIISLIKYLVGFMPSKLAIRVDKQNEIDHLES